MTAHCRPYRMDLHWVLSQALWNLEKPELYPKMPRVLIIIQHTSAATQEDQTGIWRSPGCLQEPCPSLQLQDRMTKTFVTCCSYSWHRHVHNVSIFHCPSSLQLHYPRHSYQRLTETGNSYHSEAASSVKYDAAKHLPPARLFGVIKKCLASIKNKLKYKTPSTCTDAVVHISCLITRVSCSLWSKKKDMHTIEADMYIFVNIDQNIPYVWVKFCPVI